jgi:phage N-6-adenine-methyltransferase
MTRDGKLRPNGYENKFTSLTTLTPRLAILSGWLRKDFRFPVAFGRGYPRFGMALNRRESHAMSSRNRSELDHQLVSSQEPSLARLKRDGKASAARIVASETTISHTSRIVLSEWFDQAHRLAIARANHGLKGATFREFARSIGVDGTDAFKLEQLDGHREAVFAMCEDDAKTAGYRWPGWRKALEMIAPRAQPHSVKGTHYSYRERANPNKHFIQPREDVEAIGDEWRTPTSLFSFLHSIYGFTRDVAATPETALCEQYWTKETDGLAQSWQIGDVHWMNHPYSQSALWTRKADEASQRGIVTVGLLPNRSATGWYRDFVVPSALIVQLHGRIPFYRKETGRQDITMSGAPFASILAIWPRSAGKKLLKHTKPVHAVLMEIPT